MFVLVDVLTGEVVRVELHQGQPDGGLLLMVAKFKVQSRKRFCTWVISVHMYSLSLITKILLIAMCLKVVHSAYSCISQACPQIKKKKFKVHVDMGHTLHNC